VIIAFSVEVRITKLIQIVAAHAGTLISLMQESILLDFGLFFRDNKSKSIKVWF